VSITQNSIPGLSKNSSQALLHPWHSGLYHPVEKVVAPKNGKHVDFRKWPVLINVELSLDVYRSFSSLLHGLMPDTGAPLLQLKLSNA